MCAPNLNRRGVEEIFMTIKEFAFSAQQHLQAQTGEPFKRPISTSS
jgi:hypothetical protein